MLRVFLTKQVADCSATNKQLHYRDNTQDRLCLCCHKAVEDARHITRCSDRTRRKMLVVSVERVLEVLACGGADPELMDIVEEYLLAQGRKRFVDCIHTEESPYNLLARIQDRLGWDSFVEGRISVLFRDTMKEHADRTGIVSVQKWGYDVVEALIQVTHRQWALRNARVHFRAEGLTQVEHTTLFAKVEELLDTDPDELLPAHRYLLDTTADTLEDTSTQNRQIWVLSVESARRAALCVEQGLVDPVSSSLFRQARPRTRLFARRASTDREEGVGALGRAAETSTEGVPTRPGRADPLVEGGESRGGLSVTKPRGVKLLDVPMGASFTGGGAGGAYIILYLYLVKSDQSASL